MKNENGLTLIELLAVLALSSMVVIMAVSIYTSMVKVSNKSIIETNLRNETVLIVHQLDEIMMNTDTIKIDGEADDTGLFKSFFAVDKSTELAKNEKGEDTFKENENLTSIKINGDHLLTCRADSTTLNCDASGQKRINSESYLVTDTVFSLKSSGLFVKLVVVDKDNGTKYEVNKLYSLKGE